MIRCICAEVVQVQDSIKVTANGMQLKDEYIKYDKDGNELSRIRKPKHEIALLRACKSIRFIAVPVFYHVNLFEITLNHFDAAAVQSWWHRARDIRASAGGNPLKFAWADEDVKNIKDRLGDYDVLAPELREWLATETDYGDLRLNFTMKRRTKIDTHLIIQRAITFNLTDSEPSWGDLEEWLRLWHSNQLPGFCGPFIEDVAMTPMLQAVANVFESVGALRDESWSTVQKLLPGLRKFVEGVDERWAEATKNADGNGEDKQVEDTAPPGCAAPDVEAGVAEEEEEGGRFTRSPAPTGHVVDLGDDEDEDDDPDDGDDEFEFAEPPASTQYYDAKQAQTQQEPREALRFTPTHRPTFRLMPTQRPFGTASALRPLGANRASSAAGTTTARRSSGLPPPSRQYITTPTEPDTDSE